MYDLDTLILEHIKLLRMLDRTSAALSGTRFCGGRAARWDTFELRRRIDETGSTTRAHTIIPIVREGPHA